ncbi:hypothetical protein F5X97DRAFT_304977 [Nemania serpens]|nr:hypothetical protein F5X97DRAFT_304977 [Nemania serpens]
MDALQLQKPQSAWKQTHLIKFANPSRSDKRYCEALKMILTWIPRGDPWVLNGLELQLVTSGQPGNRLNWQWVSYHLIPDAITIAKTGNSESTIEQSNLQSLRVKYFVNLLNELQEVVNGA